MNIYIRAILVLLIAQNTCFSQTLDYNYIISTSGLYYLDSDNKITHITSSVATCDSRYDDFYLYNIIGTLSNFIIDTSTLSIYSIDIAIIQSMTYIDKSTLKIDGENIKSGTKRLPVSKNIHLKNRKIDLKRIGKRMTIYHPEYIYSNAYLSQVSNNSYNLEIENDKYQIILDGKKFLFDCSNILPKYDYTNIEIIKATKENTYLLAVNNYGRLE